MRIINGGLFCLWSLTVSGCVSVAIPSDNLSGSDDDPMDPQVTVGGGFDSTTRADVVTGQDEANVCDGFFPSGPIYTLTVDSSLGMSVTLTSDDDARLWILCGQSNYCGEMVDTGTREIDRFWTRGTCEVYVGSAVQNAEVDYTLVFSEG